MPLPFPGSWNNIWQDVVERTEPLKGGGMRRVFFEPFRQGNPVIEVHITRADGPSDGLLLYQ